ncbi:MAG: motility protein A [Spartobacteria bacterium]|nr:motility protein A [Spartobacteria bacterium]
MDLGTTIGIILAWLLIIIAIAAGGGAGFLNVPSLMITVGGSLAATLTQFPLPKIMKTMAVVKKAFAGGNENKVEIVKTISDLAVRARRDGILALEDDIDKMDDEFMRKGFQMAVDGNSTDIIRNILEEDMNSMMDRHMTGQGIFKALAMYAPAFGMIGTLIGLVQMLRALDDPSAIGVGMSTALITTLYGSMVANLIALPIAGKLEQRSREETSSKAMVLEGIIAIQEGNSPRVVREKLFSYLSPQARNDSDLEEK